ncbi:hypothetical protein, partial [Clostridium haemolyticum]|uniref:hypothetical protein n=1 Tax=Clostridium haemolyticum TaxID=84025 RepID=UPI003B967CEB
MSSTPVLAATNFQSNTEKIYNSQVNKISNFKVKKSKVVYNHYTYKTAPQNVRTRYEANCKSINKTPNDSDVISVPQNLDIVKSDCRSVRSRGNNYYVGYDMERS